MEGEEAWGNTGRGKVVCNVLDTLFGACLCGHACGMRVWEWHTAEGRHGGGGGLGGRLKEGGAEGGACS